MTQYLSAEGRYEGFDPVAGAIRHCQERITPSYPNFRFQVADIYNKTYNPRGRSRDFEYRFPYDDATFDVVFAVSVFTHLLPAGTERYVAECARVLKPGGRFFATYFLLNEESSAALAAGKSTIRFPWRYTVHSLHRRWKPEAAVAYDEPFVTALYEKLGLQPAQPTAYGTWSGRPLRPGKRTTWSREALVRPFGRGSSPPPSARRWRGRGSTAAAHTAGGDGRAPM